MGPSSMPSLRALHALTGLCPAVALLDPPMHLRHTMRTPRSCSVSLTVTDSLNQSTTAVTSLTGKRGSSACEASGQSACSPRIPPPSSRETPVSKTCLPYTNTAVEQLVIPPGGILGLPQPSGSNYGGPYPVVGPALGLADLSCSIQTAASSVALPTPAAILLRPHPQFPPPNFASTAGQPYGERHRRHVNPQLHLCVHGSATSGGTLALGSAAVLDVLASDARTC